MHLLRKRMKLALFALSCFIIISCHQQSSDQDISTGKYTAPRDALDVDGEAEFVPPRTSEPPPPPEYSLDKGSKMIKNGNLVFEVTKLEETKTEIDDLIKSLDGYYENELYRAFSNTISYTLKIRLPSINFDTLINKLEKGIGELKSKNISTIDVTEEYVDLNIRLENNLAYLRQYQEVLKQAKSVKEILEVQEKIRIIEEEIDSKEGRIKYLDDNVKYSTLTLEISELITRDLSGKPNYGRRIINAFNNGIQGFLNFIVAMVNFWPFLLLIVILLLGRKPILNRIRKQRISPDD